MEKNAKNKTPIACDLTVFGTEQRQRHLILSEEVFGGYQEIRGLPDGYAFRYPGEASWYLKIAEWITRERLCCPFLTFTLEFEPEGGSVWLQLTGHEGVKQFLQKALAELGDRCVKICAHPHGY